MPLCWRALGGLELVLEARQVLVEILNLALLILIFYTVQATGLFSLNSDTRLMTPGRQ